MATEHEKTYLKVLTPRELTDQNQETSGEYKDCTCNWVSASLTGPCGDTMRIGLKIQDDRVVDSEFWGDGCFHSQSCGRLVAAQAKGRCVEELPEISPDYIVDHLKELPKDEDHCAKLAHETLMQVLDKHYKAEAGKGYKP